MCLQESRVYAFALKQIITTLRYDPMIFRYTREVYYAKMDFDVLAQIA